MWLVNSICKLELETQPRCGELVIHLICFWMFAGYSKCNASILALQRMQETCWWRDVNLNFESLVRY